MYLIFTIISLVKTKNKVIKKNVNALIEYLKAFIYFNLTNKINNFIYKKLNELSSGMKKKSEMLMIFMQIFFFSSFVNRK